MPILHTVAVKSVNPGGRLHCGQSTTVRKNGEFGFLGEYIAGSHQIHVFEFRNGAAGNHPKTFMPVVIMQPEMQYDDSRKSLLKLKNWEIKPNTPFTCVPLTEGDKLQITSDALLKNDGQPTEDGDLVVEKCYTLENDTHQLKLTADGTNAGVGANEVYYEIVKVKNAHKRPAKVAGDTSNPNYKLYTLEVKVKRA